MYAVAVAVSVYVGMVGLATGALALGGRLDRRLPLHSPVLGGLALAVMVGVPATVVAVLAARGDARSDRAAVVAGVLLVAWIAIELTFIREFSPLQPFYVAVGVSFVATGRQRGVRSRRRSGRQRRDEDAGACRGYDRRVQIAPRWIAHVHRVAIPADFMMARQMARGLKSRAERARRSAPR